MFDVMDLDLIGISDAGGGQSRRKTGDLDRILSPVHEAAPVPRMRSHAKDLSPELRLRIPRDGDMPEIGLFCILEAPLPSQRREPRPMLDSIESFFFDRSHKMAVLQECRRSVTMECVQTKYEH